MELRQLMPRRCVTRYAAEIAALSSLQIQKITSKGPSYKNREGKETFKPQTLLLSVVSSLRYLQGDTRAHTHTPQHRKHCKELSAQGLSSIPSRKSLFLENQEEPKQSRIFPEHSANIRRTFWEYLPPKFVFLLFFASEAALFRLLLFTSLTSKGLTARC